MSNLYEWSPIISYTSYTKYIQNNTREKVDTAMTKILFHKNITNIEATIMRIVKQNKNPPINVKSVLVYMAYKKRPTVIEKVNPKAIKTFSSGENIHIPTILYDYSIDRLNNRI